MEGKISHKHRENKVAATPIGGVVVVINSKRAATIPILKIISRN